MGFSRRTVLGQAAILFGPSEIEGTRTESNLFQWDDDDGLLER